MFNHEAGVGVKWLVRHFPRLQVIEIGEIEQFLAIPNGRIFNC